MRGPARLLQLHGVIVDLIYGVDAVPAPGTEALVHSFAVAAGGGFNAMASAKRSGLDVTYAGGLGSGPLGRIVSDALKAEGVEPMRVPDPTRDQGCCTVMVDRAGERTFVAREGAEGFVTDPDLRCLDLSAHGWSLLSGYTLYYPGSRDALTRWLLSDAAATRVVFDPAPIIAAVPEASVRAALARAAWVSANAAEAAQLTGLADPEAAARRLAEGRDGGAVVRTGAEGCVVAWGDMVRVVPGHPVQAVDTTGAGDAHIGAFLAALAWGDDPVAAALYANVAAALSTTHAGPATAPMRATVEATLRLRKAG